MDKNLEEEIQVGPEEQDIGNPPTAALVQTPIDHGAQPDENRVVTQQSDSCKDPVELRREQVLKNLDQSWSEKQLFKRQFLFSALD